MHNACKIRQYSYVITSLPALLRLFCAIAEYRNLPQRCSEKRVLMPTMCEDMRKAPVCEWERALRLRCAATAFHTDRKTPKSILLEHKYWVSRTV